MVPMFSSLETKWTWIRAFGILAIILFSIHVADGASDGVLTQYLGNDFQVTWDGEWWRLFSAQFLHIDWTHLLIDIGCMLVLAALLHKTSRPLTGICLFLVAGCVGQWFGVLAWHLNLTDYRSLVGSSDGIHGLIMLYIVQEYRLSTHQTERIAWIAGLLLLVVSTVYTCATGKMPFAESLRSPGYNHWGGILVFWLAIGMGLFPPRDERTHHE